MGVMRRIWRDKHPVGRDLLVIRQQLEVLTRELLDLKHVVYQLNHDVHSGADRALPLFLGYADRFRTDAETAVSASVTIDRQLALIEHRLEQLVAAAGDGPLDGDGVDAPARADG
jgi:hypothetical protein